MINQSTHLYIDNKKYKVLKQVENKFLLELDNEQFRLIVGNINNNRAFGMLYTGKEKQEVRVQTKKEFKYIGDILEEMIKNEKI